MNKKHLYIASALFSVLLIAGAAQAKTDTTGAAAMKSTTETAGEMAKPMKPGMGKMSAAGQTLMKESMAKVHEENKSLYDNMKAKREELQAIIKAPTFDKAAFVAKHEEMQTLHHKAMMARAEAKAAAFEKMSAEDRAQMGMMRGGRGMMGGKGGMGMGPDGEGCPMMDDDGPMGGMMGPGKGAMMQHEGAMKK